MGFRPERVVELQKRPKTSVLSPWVGSAYPRLPRNLRVPRNLRWHMLIGIVSVDHPKAVLGWTRCYDFEAEPDDPRACFDEAVLSGSRMVAARGRGQCAILQSEFELGMQKLSDLV